jgi:hypothetical protein
MQRTRGQQKQRAKPKDDNDDDDSDEESRPIQEELSATDQVMTARHHQTMLQIDDRDLYEVAHVVKGGKQKQQHQQQPAPHHQQQPAPSPPTGVGT